MSDTLIGSAGLVMLLAAYGLNVFGRLDRNSPMYDGMNAVGAGALVWYGVVNNTPIFVIMETTWALIAVIMLVAKLSPAGARRRSRPCGLPGSAAGGTWTHGPGASRRRGKSGSTDSARRKEEPPQELHEKARSSAGATFPTGCGDISPAGRDSCIWVVLIACARSSGAGTSDRTSAGGSDVRRRARVSAIGGGAIDQ